MKAILTCIALWLVLPLGRLHAEPSPQQAAQAAALSWLALVDGDKAAESWQALAAPARDAIAQCRWKIGIGMAQHQFGAFTGRKLRSAQFTTKSPGGRAGEFVLLEFDSTSANKGAVVEKLTTVHEADGQWRVASYTDQRPGTA